MARAIAEIERDIRALSPDEKRELLRVLITELDAPPDPNVEKERFADEVERVVELLLERPELGARVDGDIRRFVRSVPVFRYLRSRGRSSLHSCRRAQ